jgi:hypothetical protein
MNSSPFYRQLWRVPLQTGQLEPFSLQQHVEATNLAEMQFIFGEPLNGPNSISEVTAFGAITVFS